NRSAALAKSWAFLAPNQVFQARRTIFAQPNANRAKPQIEINATLTAERKQNCGLLGCRSRFGDGRTLRAAYSLAVAKDLTRLVAPRAETWRKERGGLPMENSKPLLSVGPKVERILVRHPEVKQVRIDSAAREIDLGFYRAPSARILQRVSASVHREFDGQWRISLARNGNSPLFHEHHINDHVLEFHRAHPPNEARLIWKRILLPRWRNRPVPPEVTHDYRIMLVLAAVCGASGLAGFLLQRAGFSNLFLVPLFALAYF